MITERVPNWQRSVSCLMFGSESVLEIVKSNELSAVQNNKITLKKLVLEIATFTGEVSPDALYLIIHLDPLLVLFASENKSGNPM